MITRLRVRNFKSLRHLDLTLGPLSVLVGPNMGGKSNVVDVFRFLHQTFLPEAGTQGVSYALAQRAGINEVLWKGGDEKLMTIALEGVDEYDSEAKYIYELQLIAGAGDFATVQKESLKLIRRGGLEVDLIAQQGGMQRFVSADGKDIGSIGTQGVSALQYAPPSWEGYKVRTWVGGWRFYHFLPPAMRQPSPMGLGEVLTPGGENLSAWLMWLQTRSPDVFERLNEVVRDVFSDILQVKTWPTPAGTVHLAFQERGLKRPTTVWQASDGLLAFIALLSLIYAQPALSGTLFCIEEPENHIHPRLFETLMTLFRQVRQEIADSKTPLAQVILTTHSPYLVDQVSLEELVWVEKKSGETRVFHPTDKAHLCKLIKDKELGLGDLMFSGTLGEQG